MKPTFLQGDDWRAASHPLLDANEAEYGRLIGKPEGWIVEEGGRIVLLATGKKRLLLTHGPMEAVDALAAVAPEPPAFAGPVEETARFASHHPRSHRRLRALLRVATEVRIPGTAGHLRLATPGDLPVIADWGAGFYRDTGGTGGTEIADTVGAGRLWLWDHGGPRCMAAIVRETPRGSGISLVYTPPGDRRQGWGAACTAHLAHRALAEGKEYVALYANAANESTNRLYERLGFALRGTSDEWQVR